MFRNLLALLGLACLLFVTVGYAMKWYTFDRTDGKLVITIFPDRVEEGLGKIKNSAIDFKDKVSKALTKPEEEQKAKQRSDALIDLFGPAAAPSPPPAGPTSNQSLQLPTSGR